MRVTEQIRHALKGHTGNSSQITIYADGSGHVAFMDKLSDTKRLIDESFYPDSIATQSKAVLYALDRVLAGMPKAQTPSTTERMF